MAQAGKTFRIFVSSTFSDLKAERDALQREVFPRLRELCLRHGCRFQAIDLRWGVSEEATLDQQTMKICLEELRRCQKVTPRPNFLVLLGDRYGWRPLPYEIPSAEFSEILSRLPGDGAERNRQEKLLKTWYWRDDNAAPPVYVLQPRNGEYRERHFWEPVQQELRDLLAAAIQEIDLSPEARRKYLTAATEQEIVQGLSLPDAAEHVFCFFRSIENLLVEQSAADFIDLDAQGRLDEPAQRRLDRVRDDLAGQLPGNLHFYEAGWQGNGSITTDHLGSLPESLEDCLKLNEDERASATLCVDVWRRLSRLILAEIAGLEKADPVEQESAAHKDFGRERAGRFVGRAEILGVIRAYVQGEAPHPLGVWGESGAGKSALLAQAAIEAQKAHPQAVVVQRFIGATPASSDIRLLLESLCREISRAYRAKDDDLPVEFRKLEEEFPRRLALATPDKPLILILDALDQLSEAEQARRLYWLPETLPPQVRLVVSSLPAEPDRQSDHSPFSAEGLAVLQKKLPEKHLVALDPMTIEEGGALLDTWLREAGRILQPHQREEVINKFTANGLPLYLRLAFEEARHWRSYDEPGRTRLSPDIPGVIRDLFRRLSQLAHHGEVLVSRSLGYLAAGKNGLTEDELLEVLSTEADQVVMKDFRKRSPKSPPVDRLPVAVWSRLHFDLARYLTERQADGGALLAFYHRQLREVVEVDYLSGPEKTARHAALAEYFDLQPLYLVEGQWDSRNVRKVSELPYQQTHGELWDDLEKKTLCDLCFIEAKCAAGMTYDLLNDYQRIENLTWYCEEARELAGSSTFNEWKNFLVLERENFLDFAPIIPQIVFQQAYNTFYYPEVAEVAKNIEDDGMGPIVPWFRIYKVEFDLINYSPSIRFSKKVLHHEIKLVFQDVTALAMINRDRFVSGYLDGWLAIWQISNGIREHYFKAHSWMVHCLVRLNERSFASGGDDGLIKIWDIDTGRLIQELKGHNSKILCLINSDEKLLISGSADKHIGIWDLSQKSIPPIFIEQHTDVIIDLVLLNQNIFASTSKDNTICFWRLPEGKLICSSLLSIGTNNVIMSPGGGIYSLSGNLIYWGHQNKLVRRSKFPWLYLRKKIFPVEEITLPCSEVFGSLIWIDENRILVDGPRGSIRLVDLASKSEKVLFEGGGIIRGLKRVSSQTAVSWYQDGSIWRWDLETLQTTRVAVIPNGIPNIVIPVNDTQILVATQISEEIYLIELYPSFKAIQSVNIIIKKELVTSEYPFITYFRDRMLSGELSDNDLLDLIPDNYPIITLNNSRREAWEIKDKHVIFSGWIDVINRYLYYFDNGEIKAVLPGVFESCSAPPNMRLVAENIHGKKTWVELVNGRNSVK